jgi:hypothetical protein
LNHLNSGESTLADSPANVCRGLKDLIDSADAQDELECRRYLSYAEEFLFKKDTLKRHLYSEREMPTNMGKSDYVISGIIGNNPCDPGCVRAYVWEFKAPQCFLFRKDTENRLSPTKELFEAENQLLNYYHALKFDLTLVNRLQAGHPNNVFIGGIIIGSSERLVQGDLEAMKKEVLLKDAYAIRNSYFYQHIGLLLMTWNQVLDYLDKKYVNLTKDNAVPEYTFEADRLKAGTISVQGNVEQDHQV